MAVDPNDPAVRAIHESTPVLKGTGDKYLRGANSSTNNSTDAGKTRSTAKIEAQQKIITILDRGLWAPLEKQQTDGEPVPLEIVPLGEFLKIEFPEAETLLGDPRTITYLARGNALLMYGDGGASKSTLTIDAAAHLAAGRDWLGIPVPRPCRVLLIENEGSAGLFQAKINDKLEQWDADPAWVNNIHVFAGPWGRFSFKNTTTRAELAELCAELKMDVIMANPLFGVGGPGAGRPDETGAFFDLLKDVGLWSTGPAFWLLHHENKLGQVSGDWKRLPDTTIAVARDGDDDRTKLTWEKTRWMKEKPDGWQKKWLLEWVLEHKGFRVIDADTTGVSDADLKTAIGTYLDEHPGSSKTTITDNVNGTASRVRAFLDQGVEEGVYVLENGPRGAQLHSLAPTGSNQLVDDSDGVPDGVEENPHG